MFCLSTNPSRELEANESPLLKMPFCSDFEAIVKLSDGFNGADLRNVCTEAG